MLFQHDDRSGPLSSITVHADQQRRDDGVHRTACPHLGRDVARFGRMQRQAPGRLDAEQLLASVQNRKFGRSLQLPDARYVDRQRIMDIHSLMISQLLAFGMPASVQLSNRPAERHATGMNQTAAGLQVGFDGRPSRLREVRSMQVNQGIPAPFRQSLDHIRSTGDIRPFPHSLQ